MSDNKMHINSRLAAGILAAAVVLVAPSCDVGARDRGAAPIAQVGQREILLRDFEAMLLATTAGDAPDLVRSRLLDQYLEREILLQEARHRGIRVGDEDLHRAMARDGRSPEDTGYLEKLRTALMVEVLLRSVLAQSAEITAAEEKRFFEAHPEMFHRPKSLVLRQILLDDGKSAATLRDQLMAQPGGFVEAAQQHSNSPDGGSPRVYALEDLPPEVALALRTVKPGEISPVVAMPPGFLIFLLEERREQRSISLDEARPAIQARLLESRGTGVRTQLLAELRHKLDVKLYEDNLPFRYIEENPA
jgi:parvulin-like peptidyl-prolyl isomerase